MKKRIRDLLNDIGGLWHYVRNSRRATTVEVCFNYSGVFVQVAIEPLLAPFTVSCILVLEEFQIRRMSLLTTPHAFPITVRGKFPISAIDQ